jgi:hypothetical protein
MTSGYNYGSGNPLYSYGIADETTVYNQFGTTNPSMPISQMLGRFKLYGSSLAIVVGNGASTATTAFADSFYQDILTANPAFVSVVQSFPSETAMDNYITNIGQFS